MLAAGVTVTLLALTVGLPPPLCRGRVVGAYDPNQDQTPSDRAIAEIRTAYQTLCPADNCGTGVIYQNATIGNNAVTWVSGIRDGANTRAKIVYSKEFLNNLSTSFGAGASFGVLAHEVGHHLTAALALRTPFESSWNEELRADYLAGCALGRAGRPPDELENALRALAEVATKSHPSFRERVPVVRKGYESCGGGAEPPPSFGLGPFFRDDSARPGCFYGYRLAEQVNRVGPVAAPRRRSGRFAGREVCEAHRKKMGEEGIRISNDCVCD